MRPLALCCVLGSVAAHAVAWLVWSPDLAVESPRVPPVTAILVEAALDAAEPSPPPVAVAAPAVPPAAAESMPHTSPDEVHAWREPGAESKPTTEPTPKTEAEPERVAVDVAAPPESEPATSKSAPAPAETWTRVGPPPGLRVPTAVLRGAPVADLVIDPRDRSFADRARALGMRFIVFQDGALGFYLELQGNDLRTAVRRTEVDANQFSRRARDLAGVPTFDRLRDDIAGRYGLDPARCRLAALVPVVIDHAFAGEEAQALATLRRPSKDIVALCGTLTGDAARPLRITHALTAEHHWLELKS